MDYYFGRFRLFSTIGIGIGRQLKRQIKSANLKGIFFLQFSCFFLKMAFLPLYHRSKIKMLRQIYPLTASTLALKLNFRDGPNVQFECQSAYMYYFLQRLEKSGSASVIRRLPIIFMAKQYL